MDANTKVYIDFPSKELGNKKNIKTLSLMLKLNLLFQLKDVNSFQTLL